MIYFYLISGGFICSSALTYLVRQYALRNNVLDHPVDRSSHKSPTPRGGGLSIVITYLMLVMLLTHFGMLQSQNFWYLIIPGSMIAIIGFIDDHRSIHFIFRLFIHFLSASLALALLPGLPSIQFAETIITNPWILYPLYTIALVWLLNLFNFIDGIDGIAGSEAFTVLLLATGILYFHTGSHWNYLLLALSTSIAGFLVWNWAPASVFLGDVGSGFLGFIIGVIALITSFETLLNIWSWLILLSVFVTDATWTLIVRVKTRQNWLEPHRNHAYQILSRVKNSHAFVSLAVIGINVIWLGPIAFAATLYPGYGLFLSIVAYLPIICICWYLRAGFLNNKSTLV